MAAGLLSDLGISASDRVGLFSTNSTEALEVLFASSLVGSTIVPMNYRAADEEVRHLLTDSGCTVVFTETRYLELVEANRPFSVKQVIDLRDG